MKKVLIKSMILISSAIFIGILVFGMIYIPNDEVQASPELTKIAEIQSEQPNHSKKLVIPTLDIDAEVQDVGITRKGNISAPTNFSDVGWYKYGPLPGEPGTAVIDGHVNNGLGTAAVFSNLKNIKYGDSVYVETENNKTLKFIVKKIEVYDYNAPTNNILVKTNSSRLLLITCAGSWVPTIKTHDKRLVVTAVLAT